MAFVHTGVWDAVTSLGLAALVLFACRGTGSAVLERFGIKNGLMSPQETSLFGTALGILFLSLTVLALGSFKVLTRMNVWIVVCVFLALSLTDRPRRTPFHTALDYFRKNRGLGAMVAAILFLAMLQTLLPPTANDALAYHLEHPKEFILYHETIYLPFTRDSLWPYQTEMLFTLGLLLQGTTLAQLFHWVFFPLVTFAVYYAGARFLGAEAARWGAFVLALTPAVFAQSGQAYVDLALAFYVFMSFYLFLIYRESRSGRLAFLSGLLMGGALGTKYLGLASSLVLAVMICIVSPKKTRDGSVFAAGAAVAGGVWYLRSWAVSGNPVYPFFYKFFGGHGFPSHIAEGVGMGNGPGPLFSFPWNITFHPAPFGGEVLGPLYLALVPSVFLFGDRMKKPLAWALVFCAGYGTILFHLSQQVRFFLSLAPVLSFIAGYSIVCIFEAGAAVKKTTMALLAIVAALHLGAFIERVREAPGVILGQISPEDYLSRKERSFKGFRYLETHASVRETLFNSAETRLFYNPGLQMVYDGPLLRQYLAKEGRSVTAYLDAKRFDHLWLSEDSDPEVASYASSRGYKSVYSYEFTEAPKTFRYSIWSRA